MVRWLRHLIYGGLGIGLAIAPSLLRTPVTVSVPIVSPSNSAVFTADPPYSQVESFTTQIGADPAVVYLPTVPMDEIATPFPVALMLPGALVNYTQYSEFAQIVAQYGFVVIVAGRERSLPELGSTGQFAEAAQITEVLAYVAAAASNPTSRLFGRVNPEKMALLGHSHGGAVGLLAIADTCVKPFFCTGSFTRPPEVIAGVFYGTHTYNPQTESYAATPNARIPVALIQGTQDSVATVEEVTQTYHLIESPPKALITVEGANHFGITNENNPEGAIPDASDPRIEQDESVEAIAQWTAYFLQAHVLNDPAALEYVYSSGDAQDERVTVEGAR